ncbi:MAG: nucleoside kinase [Clostridiales Family XIII bacterium]|jgi:uridine kinase|nr:nucleoside kinase [Clostridiales Family XIII bacterium]
MAIEISIQFEKSEPPFVCKVEQGITLVELTKEFAHRIKYRIIAALVDNIEKELTYRIQESCHIRFLDLRSNIADRIYQRSLCLVYLKAANDILGNADIDILNSINRGLYTETNKPKHLTDAQIIAIGNRMKEIISADMPIEKTVESRDELLAQMQDHFSAEKLELVRHTPDIQNIAIYSIDGYSNYFYGHMVPSTGCLDVFGLNRYQNGMLLRYPDTSYPNVLPPYVNDEKIFDEFARGWNIAKSLDSGYAGDLNREISNGSSAEIITISERLHVARIKSIARSIIESQKRVVLISGPSSSGKTTFANRLSSALAIYGTMPLYLGTDDYFIDRALLTKDEDGEYNFEDLDAVDVEAFNNDVNALLLGEEVDLPIFDFIEGKRIYGNRKTRLEENQLIVIEGIHGLNANLSLHIPENQKFRVYISPLSQLNIDDHNRIPTTDVRLLRRILRDSRTRGKSVNETIRLWPKVRAGENINIFPFNHEADMVFNSALLYEVSVLRLFCEPLLMQVSVKDPEYSEAKRLLSFLKFFSPLEATDVIPKQSILREFIGGGLLE